MRIAMIGAGAMGGSYGGLLADAGADVTLIDGWREHVDAINQNGLRVEGALGEHLVRLPAVESAPDGSADCAVIFVDANNTAHAGKVAARVLTPEGFALTLQNGVGNVEALQEALGAERVVAGSSICSAATRGPGHVALTHMGTTTLGEPGGGTSARVIALAGLLEQAGFEVATSADVMAVIWQKFLVNCAINAICATTGLRLGEVVRLPELDAFQDNVIAEALAVTKAKGVNLPDPDFAATAKSRFRRKFSKPSMLQHVEAARRTEIDALNGALVREARALGIAVPYNEALVALLKGRELHSRRAARRPPIDYAAWEAEVAAGREPPPDP